VKHRALTGVTAQLHGRRTTTDNDYDASRTREWLLQTNLNEDSRRQQQ
jgi:hypothetical protein